MNSTLALKPVVLTCSIDESRMIWNNNFQLVESAINQFTNMINISDNSISNIKRIELFSGNDYASSKNKILLNAENSTIEVDNLVVSKSISTKRLNVETTNPLAMSVSRGDVQFGNNSNSSPSNLTVNGAIINYGINVEKNITTLDVNSSDNIPFSKYYYENPDSYKLGLIDKNTVILNLTKYNPSSNDRNNRVCKITLEVPETKLIGQKIKLIFKLNNETEYNIMPDNISTVTDVTNKILKSIKIDKNNTYIELLNLGNTWLVINNFGATLIV